MIVPGVTASGRQVAPSVRTDAASSVTVSGGVLAQATLNGTVLRAENSNNSVVFRWGTVSDLSSFNTTSPATVVAQGSTNIAVSANLTNLADGTTYYYRVVSTNTGGTTLGDIVSFTTPINAPVVTVGSGSNATSAPTATLNNVSNFAKTTATFSGTFTGSSAYFEYSTDSTFTSTLNTSSVTTSPITQSVSNLDSTGNKTYYYRLRATNTSLAFQMSGTVNPNGRSTSVTFEYSKNNQFNPALATVYSVSGVFTATGQSTSSSTSAQGVSVTTSANLSSGDWYFRIKATSVGGTSTSASSTSVKIENVRTDTPSKSFTTYVDRSELYTTPGSHTWSYPSIPAGGAAITSVNVGCVGGGGGGAKGSIASGGGGGQRVSGSLPVNNNNIEIVVGYGGLGGGRVSNKWTSRSGQASSATSGASVISAAGGVGGTSDAPFSGGSSTFAGGSGYDDGFYIRLGGGGGGSGGSGGNAGSDGTLGGTYAGVGGKGTGEDSGGESGGGGGGGFFYSVRFTQTFWITAVGKNGGGNAVYAAGFSADATARGGGGGAGVNGQNGGNGYSGGVLITWVGPAA